MIRFYPNSISFKYLRIVYNKNEFNYITDEFFSKVVCLNSVIPVTSLRSTWNNLFIFFIFFCLKLVNNFFVVYYFTKTLLVYFALINKFIEFQENWAAGSLS